MPDPVQIHARALDDLRRKLDAGDVAGAVLLHAKVEVQTGLWELPPRERDRLIEALFTADRARDARPHLENAVREPGRSSDGARMRLAALLIDTEPRRVPAMLQAIDVTGLSAADRAWRTDALNRTRGAATAPTPRPADVRQAGMFRAITTPAAVPAAVKPPSPTAAPRLDAHGLPVLGDLATPSPSAAPAAADDGDFAAVDALMKQNRWDDARRDLDGRVQRGGADADAARLRLARIMLGVDSRAAKAVRLLGEITVAKLSAPQRKLFDELRAEAQRLICGSTTRLTR